MSINGEPGGSGDFYEIIREAVEGDYREGIEEADKRVDENAIRGKRVLALERAGVQEIDERELDEINILGYLGEEPDDVSVSESVSDTSEKQTEIVEKVKSLFLGEIRDVVHEQKEITNLRAGLSLDLKLRTRRLMREKRYNPNSSDTDRIRDRISECDDKSAELCEKNQGSFLATKMLECQQMLREKREGGIMTTPYVERKSASVREEIDSGAPVFIHGHLGSGKTELAISVAKESAIDRQAETFAFREFSKFCKEQGEGLGRDEKLMKLGELFTKRKEYLEAIVSGVQKPQNADDEVILDKCTPLILSGSRDIETRDMLLDKGLTIQAPFEGKETAEVMDEFEREYDAFRVKENYGSLSEEEQERKDRQFYDFYKTKNAAFGTQMEIVENAVLRGIKEGRPVIIDEANSIPMGVLLSLNNILNRRPGETCYVPGVGNVEIEDGFAIIMTGNFSEGDIEYNGTESALNPALESRLKMIEYSYLPQSETGEMKDRIDEDAEKDELFQIALMYIANKRGSIEVAGGDEELEKLFSLAQVARTTQMMFSGGHTDSGFYKDSGYAELPRIQSPPISVRGLLKILDGWGCGRRESLDQALFENYISGIHNPEEQKLVFQCAQNAGFFSKKDGWELSGKISEDGKGKLVTDIDEIYYSKDSIRDRSVKHYPMMDVIHLMYGDGPDATEYFRDITDRVMQELEGDEDDVEAMTEEEYAETAKNIEGRHGEVGQAIEFLKIFGGQCGCEV